MFDFWSPFLKTVVTSALLNISGKEPIKSNKIKVK